MLHFIFFLLFLVIVFLSFYHSIDYVINIHYKIEYTSMLALAYEFVVFCLVD